MFLVKVKRKIKRYIKTSIEKDILSENMSTTERHNLTLKYLKKYHKYQYVAQDYLKELLGVVNPNKTFNPLKEVLKDQEVLFPDFFRKKFQTFDLDKCLGITKNDRKSKYKMVLQGIDDRTNDFDCEYFLSKLSNSESFHYLKYTHGFWDFILESKIKEYALQA